MNKQFKVMVICPTMTDATSFYRGIMPISVVAQQIDIQSVFVNDVNWATLAMVDAVFMQRPSTDGHLTIAKMCNQWGKPLWMDYDDDLFTVEDDNPTHAYYGRADTQKRVAEIIARADVVSVSTENLRKQLTKGPGLNKDIRVIPNSWAISRLPERQNLPRNKLILWRGSKTHARDVASVGQEILELSHANQDWTWHFIGGEMDQFWWLHDQMPKDRCILSSPLDIIEYLGLIQTIAPAITISPLLPTRFNLSKSNIAWMEGIYAGAVHVAPQIPEFTNKPGCVTYNDKVSFTDCMNILMKQTDENLQLQSQSGWDYITENLSLERINEHRIAIIETLKAKSH